MRINEAWHRAHPMPKHPSLADRIEWHEEHARLCGCREIPPRLRAEIKRRKKK